MGGGGVIASGIKVINGFAVEENLDLSAAINIEGVEVEADVVGGIKDIECERDRTIRIS